MTHSSHIKLRLSAQRALLGAITPNVRLIKVVDDGSEIIFTVIAASPLDEAATDALSIAATEIVADYADRMINEITIVDAGPLQKENILEAGWVYLRAE